MVIAGLASWRRLSGTLIAATAILSATERPLAAQGGDVWKPLAPLPVARRLLAAATEGGKVYTFGGCGSPCFGPPAHTSTFEETLVEVYDPVADTWTRRGPIPEIFFGGAAAAPGNGRIYLVGGFLTGDRLLEYDPTRDSWRARAPMPTARHGLAAVALGGLVYVVGGSDGMTASGALEVYDPATDSWRRGTPMPTPRVFLGAAALGGRIYAVGGSPDCCGDSRTAAVEVYDPATDRWSAAAPLPIAEQASAVAAVGGRLLVLGGFVPGQGVRAETLEYDPATDAWSERAPMPSPRDQAPAVVLGGNVFVPGGSVDCHCQARDELHCYTPGGGPGPGPGPGPGSVDLAVLSVTDRSLAAAAGGGPAARAATPQVAPTGDVREYTITVGNVGEVDVPRARVTDRFPSRLEAVTWRCTATAGASCTASGAGDIVDDGVELPVGGRVTYVATVKVGPAPTCPLPDRLVNRARVEPLGGLVDGNPANDTALDRNDVSFSADLTATVTPMPAVVRAGDVLGYLVALRNLGPDAACGAGFEIVSPDGDGGAAGTGVDRGEIDLPAGGLDTLVLDIEVEPSPICPIIPRLEAVATISTPPGVIDPEPENNVAAGAAERLATVALDLAKSDGETSIVGGEATRYLVTAVNRGPDAACGARVHDPAPPELGDVTWSCEPAGGARCTSRGEGDLDDLGVEVPAGAALVYTVDGTAVCTGAATLENTATVELPPGQVVAEAMDVDALVCPVAEATLTKRRRGSCTEGSVIHYLLELTNPGAVPRPDLPGDELVDTLPPFLTLVAAAADLGTVESSGNQVRWNGEVPAGGTVSFDLTATIDAATLGQIVCNRAALAVDTDGDGVYDASLESDDPTQPGDSDATCFRVCPQVETPIPAASGGALLALALALLAAGWLVLRRG